MPGVGRPCTVCGSPNLAEVDRFLNAGMQAAAVSRHFGLSEKAVGNHRRKGHVRPDPVEGQPLAPTPEPPRERPDDDDPVGILVEHMATLRAVDTSTLSPAQRTAHHEEIRRTAVELARIAPPQGRSVVTIREVDGLVELLATMTKVLDRFPDARDAMVPALAEWRERYGA